MGKDRKTRQKLYLAAKSKKSEISNGAPNAEIAPSAPSMDFSENVFGGIKIDVSNIVNKLPDDVQSVKSFKSLKSELSGKKILPKKDKLKLRRQMFLKKMDLSNQLKKENELRNKRKNTAIIGDINPLYDALPSLDSLLTSKSDIKHKQSQPKKLKGIEKASKQKKELIQGVRMFKQLYKNKSFQKNPLNVISERVKAVIEAEKVLEK